eukprot:1335985-Amorphochlora_amoeboformis.AAC.1
MGRRPGVRLWPFRGLSQAVSRLIFRLKSMVGLKPHRKVFAPIGLHSKKARREQWRRLIRARTRARDDNPTIFVMYALSSFTYSLVVILYVPWSSTFLVVHMGCEDDLRGLGDVSSGQTYGLWELQCSRFSMTCPGGSYKL